MPGTTRHAARPGQRRVDQPGRGQQVAEGPLEGGHRRQPAPKTRQRARFGASESGVPLPCATIMPTSPAAARRRPARHWIARARPSPSARIGRAHGLAGAAAAQQLAEHGGAAARPAASVSSISAAAPSPSSAAVVARIEGPQRLRRQQAELLIVEQRLRLDRRVVAADHGAAALAGAQRGRGLGHRQQAADAWLVMQAFGPLRPWRMPTWQSTLLGSVRSSHIGLTVAASSWPKAFRSPWPRRSAGSSRMVAEAAAARADEDAGAVVEALGCRRRPASRARREAGCSMAWSAAYRPKTSVRG